MLECTECGTVFDVSYADEESEVNYCPHCGEEYIGEN